MLKGSQLVTRTMKRGKIGCIEPFKGGNVTSRAIQFRDMQQFVIASNKGRFGIFVRNHFLFYCEYGSDINHFFDFLGS